MADKKPVKGSMLDRLSVRASGATNAAAREVEVPLEKIRFDPKQPRQRYHTLDGQVADKDQAYIKELAASIESQDLIHAITVAEQDDGTYIVRIGECRTRAHLLLGRKTIRAVINNSPELENRQTRLLYQLSENINRNDLEDWEVAGNIKELLRGDPDNGVEPLSQAEIADKLGKSEGYITRYVVFGDEELQRRWVQTGIVDTAEKLYRLKLLPPAMHLEILRRVELSEDNPEHLAKPLKRSVIDDYAKLNKLEKNRLKPGTGKAGGAATQHPFLAGANAAHTGEQLTGQPDSNDSIGQALAEAARQGKGDLAAPADTQNGAPAGPGGTAYKLDPNLRDQIRGQTASSNARADADRQVKAVPPINCRVPVSALENLIPLLNTKPEVLKALRGARCDVLLPADLAQMVAAALVGVVVDAQVLPATIQSELSKLS